MYPGSEEEGWSQVEGKAIVVSCYVRSDFREDAPPAGGVACLKDHPYGDNKEVAEDKGIAYGHVYAVSEAAECCMNVILEKKDIFIGMCDAKVP